MELALGPLEWTVLALSFGTPALLALAAWAVRRRAKVRDRGSSSLVECPDCQARISTSALACPHCGCPRLHDSDRLKSCPECRAPVSIASRRCPQCGGPTTHSTEGLR